MRWSIRFQQARASDQSTLDREAFLQVRLMREAIGRLIMFCEVGIFEDSVCT